VTLARTTLLALAGLLVGASACNRGGSSEADPSYAQALPGRDDVDDSLASIVTDTGELRVRLPIEPDDPSKGAAEPLVVVVEFSDFQCPHCGNAAQAFDELLAAYPDEIRLVFKQFPLPMHPDAEIGARAALAARAQGKFWAMHDLLFANRSAMKRDEVLAHAERIGLDRAEFEAALDDSATAARVKQDKATGIGLGVRGTPSFFVNGRPFSGMLPPERLQQVIEAERALGRKLVDAGSARRDVYARILRAADDLQPEPPPKAAPAPPPSAREGE